MNDILQRGFLLPRLTIEIITQLCILSCIIPNDEYRTSVTIRLPNPVVSAVYTNRTHKFIIRRVIFRGAFEFNTF